MLQHNVLFWLAFQYSTVWAINLLIEKTENHMRVVDWTTEGSKGTYYLVLYKPIQYKTVVLTLHGE